MNKILRRTLKILGWTVAGIVVLLLLVVVLIQVPAVQNFARGKVVVYLQKKLGTRVEIGHLSVDFPKKIVLENIYFEDQKKDTLIAGQRLAVDIAMFQLLKSRLEINDIELSGIRANIYRRGADSFFNYDYIVKAFTNPTAAPNPADTAGVKINIRHVALSKILATFRDDATGSDMYLYLGDFESRIDKFDLDHSVFDVPEFRLQHVVARMYQHKPLVEPKTEAEVKAANTGAPDLQLTLGPVTIGDIDFDFANDVSALTARIRLGNMHIVPEKLDLPKLQVVLKSFELSDLDAVVRLGNTAAAKEVEQQAEVTTEAQAANPWRIAVRNLDLQNNHLKFDNDNQARTAGMDYGHLDIKELDLEASDLAFTPELYTGDISRFSFNEQSGFVLKELRTSFLYDDRGVELKDLYLQTNKSLIKDEIKVGWPSLDMLVNNPGEMMIRANLDHSKIAFSDVLTFAPMLAPLPPFYKNEKAVFAVNGQIRGYVKDLEIPSLEASGMQGTSFKISGRIKGLPDPNRTIFNLNIAQLRTTQSDLLKFLPPGTVPPTVRIPEAISLSGAFAGSMSTFNTKLAIRTNRGNADVVGTMRNMSSYDLAIGLGGLDLGYIMKQEQNVGRVSGKAIAVGSGFDPATMVATIKMNVFAANVRGYEYRNLVVDARLNRGDIAATANMRDPNISFNMDISSLIKGGYPALKMNMQLDSVNLKALGLYKSDLRIHGRVIADLASTNPDALVGTIDVSDLIIYNEGKRYVASDTIHIASAQEGPGYHLSVRSAALAADLQGQYKLTELAQALQHTINRYYTIPGFVEAPFAPQQWALRAVIHPSPLLFSVMPEMKGTDSIQLAVDYNSSAEDLKLAANAPRIVYGTNKVDSLTFRAATGNTLNYGLSFFGAGSGEFKLNHTSISGDIANNQVTTALDIRDRSDRSRYKLGATLNQTPNNGYRVVLAPGLMLDYDDWSVGADNFVQYDDAGIIVHNFSISNGAQSISAASTTEIPTAPVDVRFSNFSIGTITQIVQQDSMLAGGLINGTVQLRNPTKDLVFTSDLAIAGLSYRQDTIGDVTIRINNETEATLAANIRVTGHGNDIVLDGRYFIPSEQMDMDLDIHALSMHTIRNFSGGQLLTAEGNLRGKLAVNGTLDKPAVDGQIRFDSAYITPTLLGERFALTDEAVDVNATGIHFNSFTLVDSSNNIANIDGDLLTDDFKNYRFALNITADNFQAVNAPRGVTHKPFYGKMNLSTRTRIRGDMNLPIINSYVRINKNTDFSYVLPANDPEVQSRIGVVEFVDMSSPSDSTIFVYPTDTVTNAGMRGLDVNATLETDSAANFNIVIDERNGDALHIRGVAALQAGIDRSGKVSLTGTYTMLDGSYLLTLNFLKRQFFIRPGSTITWDGDPTQATVDITAYYTATTAPIDLVQHQLAGRSQYEINQYKSRVPFNVLLNMRGELMTPKISFDIVLPEKEQNRLKDVDAKLAQIRTDESELNKQVFALLMLGHFVNENPLETNGTPTTAESFARQSASRILTDQLNRLAANLLPGVDLTFGVNSGSDYSTGELAQRTDLTVGVSKRLMNDRLKVNVGSSFGLEGPTAPNQAATNIAGDLSLDYKLSKDGRYNIRAYRQNNYDYLVEGQVVETGATFIFKIDYDNLNEFFRKPRKKDVNPPVH